MFTDMVGYSALTQKNEWLALDLLDEHREILRPIFSKHYGREIDTAGDSFFVEFDSAVEATNCAIDIQTVLHQRNLNESADRQIRLRIGLHIGDVVHRENQVFGDGVNIAARMEPLAQPEGICLSEDVARQVRNKIDLPLVPLGKERLKNITLPMNIYYVQLPWLIPEQRTGIPFLKQHFTLLVSILMVTLTAAGFFFFTAHPFEAGHSDGSFSKYRLAVLPLVNISQNPENEIFADGMTEELISSLSKIGDLRVIAHTSVKGYKDLKHIASIRDISRELKVGSIIEGSVRRYDNKARINVKLIDATTQEPIWSMDYDRELKDIISVQSEIAKNVAYELQVRLVSADREQLEKSPTNNSRAYEEYLVGRYFLNQRTSAGISQAITSFESSIALDSSFALPYAHLAYAYTLVGTAGYGNIQKEVAESKAKAYVLKALEIDETLADAHAALAYIEFRVNWNWTKAEEEFKTAIRLNPSYATAHEWYALFLAVHSRLDEALREIQTAVDLDPHSSSVSTGLARIYHFRQEYQQAIAQNLKTLENEPNYAEAHFALGMTYSRMKEFEKAAAALQKALELSGRRPVVAGTLGVVYSRLGKMEEVKELLAEFEQHPASNDRLYALSMIKYSTGKTDEAMDLLERLFEDKYGVLIYMQIERDEYGIGKDPRYQRLLEKMGFSSS